MRVLLLLLLLGLGALGAPPAAPPSPELLAAVEQQALQLSNAFRASQGLPPLAGNDSLFRAARLHSEEMAKMNYFDHESPVMGRRFPWDRLNQLGVDADGISENIYLAEGYPLDVIAAMAVKSWETSPEHRHNLLDPAKTNMGLGVAVHGSQIYVTQVFSSAPYAYTPAR